MINFGKTGVIKCGKSVKGSWFAATAGFVVIQVWGPTDPSSGATATGSCFDGENFFQTSGGAVNGYYFPGYASVPISAGVDFSVEGWNWKEGGDCIIEFYWCAVDPLKDVNESIKVNPESKFKPAPRTCAGNKHDCDKL